MSHKKLEVKPINLSITLYPSFVLSLLLPMNGAYLKAAGRKRGCLMRARGSY